MATETLNQSAPSTDYPTGPVPTIPEPTATPEATNLEAKATEETKATEPAKTEEVKAETKETATEEKVEAKPEEAKKDEDSRLDKNPRFQEVIKSNQGLKRENQTLKTQVETALQRLDAIEKARQEKGKPIGEELRELYEEDPVAALERAIEIGEERAYNRVSTETSQKQTYQQLSTALGSFQKDNPDFTELYEAGDLQRVQEENPILNTPIAAYLHVKLENEVKKANESWEAKVKEEVEKAKAEVTKTYEDKIKEIKANHAAKKEITVVEESPANRETITDAGLKTNGKSMSETLYQRHLARQRASGLA